MWTNRYIGSRLKYLVLPLAFAAAFGARAQAQTVSSFATGGSFTYDGLTFTISGCSSNASAGSSAACGAVEMKTVSQSRGSVAIEFLGNGGIYGSNALTVAQNGSNATTSFTLSVSSASAQVTGLSAAVTSSPQNISYASLPFQVNGTTGCTITSGTQYPYGSGCEPYSGGSTNAAVAFSPTASLSINYALSVNAQSTQADSLSTAITTFSKIPEPGSFAVLGSGLMFLGFAHLRARHGRRTNTRS